jgi:hypothetical protein
MNEKVKIPFLIYRTVRQVTPVYYKLVMCAPECIESPAHIHPDLDFEFESEGEASVEPENEPFPEEEGCSSPDFNSENSNQGPVIQPSEQASVDQGSNVAGEG